MTDVSWEILVNDVQGSLAAGAQLACLCPRRRERSNLVSLALRVQWRSGSRSATSVRNATHDVPKPVAAPNILFHGSADHRQGHDTEFAIGVTNISRRADCFAYGA